MRRISVRAIILRGDKLLCVKLRQYNRTSRTMDGAWCLPGGTLEDGEALIPALEREIVEELSAKPNVGNLLYVQQFMEPDKDNLEFFFHVTNAKDYVNIDLSKTTHGAEEIEAVEFVDPKTTKILPKFLATEPLAEHAASKSPAKVFSATD